MSDDPFASYDAVYVLGALDPAERQRYEQHLRECPTCTIAVRELAGLPGLLARAGPAPRIETEDAAPRAPIPSAPARRVRRRPRTRRLLTAIAVGVAACLGALLLVGRMPAAQRPTSAPAATPTAMAHVVPAPIDARIQLSSVSWGTRIVMHCRYRDRPPYPRGPYRLVVVDDAGRIQSVASWRAVPGKVSTISASVDLFPAQISSEQVRAPTGQLVLRAG